MALSGHHSPNLSLYNIYLISLPISQVYVDLGQLNNFGGFSGKVIYFSVTMIVFYSRSKEISNCTRVFI